MKQRDFLEKVSKLAKGSAAAVTLSKVQIGVVGAALAAGCTKENPLTTRNVQNQDMAMAVACSHEHPYTCSKEANGCTSSDRFQCTSGFSCYNNDFACEKSMVFVCNNSEYYTGGQGGT
jgi:hypothetical protein